LIEVRLGITASPKILYSVLFNRVNPFNHNQGMITRRFLLSQLFFSLFFFWHCTKSPTDSKGLSLSGFVKLEGQTEHSGTTVALYALAELDTMVLRMNKEFPMVGIPISQITELTTAWPSRFTRRKQKLMGATSWRG